MRTIFQTKLLNFSVNVPPPSSVSTARAEKGFMQPLPSSSSLLQTIAPKCLMRRRSSGAFCRNPLSSFNAFCSLILGVTACRSQRRCASVPSHYTSFRRSYYIQWHLYDNCTAGDINYAFRRSHVSSHHLLAACIRLDKARVALPRRHV